MSVRALHPILYVSDPKAERDFFALFGFETTYEGPEFPDFLAIQSGAAVFGLSGNRQLTDGAHNGVRWQLMVDDVDDVLTVCAEASLPYEVVVEQGGEMHRARIAKVISPGGVVIWFEGPNELT